MTTLETPRLPKPNAEPHDATLSAPPRMIHAPELERVTVVVEAERKAEARRKEEAQRQAEQRAARPARRIYGSD